MAKKIAIVLAVLLMVYSAGCANAAAGRRRKVYKVHKLKTKMPIDANWQKDQYKNVLPLSINKVYGKTPKFIPKTQAKLLWDNENIYIIFRVKDRFVKAVSTKPNGKVWNDSCVEMFVATDPEKPNAYFNIETNCIGTVRLRHQTEPKKDWNYLKDERFSDIEIATSFAKAVAIDPEQQNNVIWYLEYKLPIAVLESLAKVERPAVGVTWGANFFKSGDDTSNPHWISFSTVTESTKDTGGAFHQPWCFGTIEFVD